MLQVLHAQQATVCRMLPPRNQPLDQHMLERVRNAEEQIATLRVQLQAARRGQRAELAALADATTPMARVLHPLNLASTTHQACQQRVAALEAQCLQLEARLCNHQPVAAPNVLGHFSATVIDVAQLVQAFPGLHPQPSPSPVAARAVAVQTSAVAQRTQSSQTADAKPPSHSQWHQRSQRLADECNALQQTVFNLDMQLRQAVARSVVQRCKLVALIPLLCCRAHDAEQKVVHAQQAKLEEVRRKEQIMQALRSKLEARDKEVATCNQKLASLQQRLGATEAREGAARLQQTRVKELQAQVAPNDYVRLVYPCSPFLSGVLQKQTLAKTHAEEVAESQRQQCVHKASSSCCLPNSLFLLLTGKHYSQHCTARQPSCRRRVGKSKPSSKNLHNFRCSKPSLPPTQRRALIYNPALRFACHQNIDAATNGTAVVTEPTLGDGCIAS